MYLNKHQMRTIPVVLGGGFLGQMLRIVLYLTGFDHKGFLPASHPLHLACLALAAGMLAYLGICTLKAEVNTEDQPQLRLPLGLAAGFFLLIHGLSLYPQAASAITGIRKFPGFLPLIQFVLTAAAAIAMAVCALYAHRHRSTVAACHGIVCAAFGADMLSRYRVWSGNPQLPDYVFHVLAGAALSLCAYQTLALYTGLEKRKLQQFFCLSSLFLCVLCLSGPEPRAFYLGGALWSAACLVTAPPPEEEAIQEENSDVSA